MIDVSCAHVAAAVFVSPLLNASVNCSTTAMAAFCSALEVEPWTNTIRLIATIMLCMLDSLHNAVSRVTSSFLKNLDVIDRLTLGVGPLRRDGHDLSIL